METFNPHQYQDLMDRGEDVYSLAKYQWILDRLLGLPPQRMLNAGCGAGDLSFLLGEKGHSVVGIDSSKEYIDLAKERLPAHLANRCSFLTSSIEAFDPVAPFDCVLATDVIEHIRDDRNAVAKLSSFLRPGGLLFLTIPALPFLFGYHDELLGHYRRYTKKTLRRALLEGEHMDILALRYFGFVIIPVCLLYSTLLRKEYPVVVSSQTVFATLRNSLLSFLLSLERSVPLPLGASLLLVAKKRD